jgi:hypothetical protein
MRAATSDCPCAEPCFTAKRLWVALANILAAKTGEIPGTGQA